MVTRPPRTGPNTPYTHALLDEGPLSTTLPRLPDAYVAFTFLDPDTLLQNMTKHESWVFDLAILLLVLFWLCHWLLPTLFLC